MSLIRSRGNRDTELRLIAIMRAHRITDWRRNRPLFGKPDFVFPKLKLAVFGDGCFWHGWPLPATSPKTNAVFWRKKIAANRTRDRLVNPTLPTGPHPPQPRALAGGPLIASGQTRSNTATSTAPPLPAHPAPEIESRLSRPPPAPTAPGTRRKAR